MTARLAKAELISLAGIGERGATGNSAAFDNSRYSEESQFVLMCESVSGGGRTLDVRIQDSPDGTTDWQDTDVTFDQVTTADSDQNRVKDISGLRRFVRAAWTIAGATPVFRFGVAILSRPKQG